MLSGARQRLKGDTNDLQQYPDGKQQTIAPEPPIAEIVCQVIRE